MTKDELKALIAAKIQGQGTAVDAASALPAILNGIIDAIPEGGGGLAALPETTLSQSGDDVVGTPFGDDIVGDIIAGKYHAILVNFDDGVNITEFTNPTVFTLAQCNDVGEADGVAVFRATDPGTVTIEVKVDVNYNVTANAVN